MAYQKQWSDMGIAEKNVSKMWLLEPMEFTILKKDDGFYNAYGRMSTIKETTKKGVRLWWGYSLQVNLNLQEGDDEKNRLDEDNFIEQYLMT